MLPVLPEGMVEGMSLNIPEQVEEHRAAVLLGLPMTEIRRFSRLAGLGHLEKGDRGEQVCLYIRRAAETVPHSRAVFEIAAKPY
jgi:hypothetical protein